MKKLSTNSFNLIEDYILKEARPLEKAVFNYYFNKKDANNIIKALAEYQNKDGGFGNCIEPDYRLIDSSPLATSIGLRHLSVIDNLDSAQMMISRAIAYLENTYNEGRKGWYSVPKSINDYPHAPWWTYLEDINMTVIDYSWGNPSAELIGYLYKYKQYVKALDVNELVNYAIDNFILRSDLNSEHEVYCYIRMYNILEKGIAGKLDNKLKEAISKLVVLDEAQWVNYVPAPINFIEINSNNYFGIIEKDIHKNLEYNVNALEKNYKLEPNWEWDNYKEEWKVAKEEWKGIITVEALLKLQKFKWI